MLCDVSTGKYRPLVPDGFRKLIFDALHSLSHPGAQPTIRLISERFVWPGLCRDVRDWCCQCHPCQASKITRYVQAPVVVLPPAACRFGNLHLDIVGPLPPSEENRCLLTIVNRFSRWPKAIPLRDVSSAPCSLSLIHI